MARALLVICVILLASWTVLADNDDHHKRPELDEDVKAALEELKPVLEACKDQAQTLCPRPPREEDHDDRRLDRDDDDHKRRPNPFRLFLCVDDHSDSLTGECLNTWNQVSASTMELLEDTAIDMLTPPARYKRACRSDVEQHCRNADNRDDVMSCLKSLFDAGNMTEACQAEFPEAEAYLAEAIEEEDLHPSYMLDIAAFDEIDDLEMEGDDDERDGHGSPVLMIAGVAVVAAVAVGAVAAGIIFMRRKAAAARRTQPRFEEMTKDGFRRANSLDSTDSDQVIMGQKVQLTQSAPTATVVVSKSVDMV